MTDTLDETAAEQAYPRDFDIRARYAEQQELLNPDREPEPAPASHPAH